MSWNGIRTTWTTWTTGYLLDRSEPKPKPKPKPRLSLHTWFRCARCGQMSRAAAEWRAHVNDVHIRGGVAVPGLLSYRSAQQFPTCTTCVPMLGFSDDQKYTAHLEDVHGSNAPLPDVQRRQRRHL